MLKNIKILHLADDEKFIDSAYLLFESVAPSCNTFLIPSINKKVKYIKQTPIKVISILSFKNPFFIKSLEKYDIIILHSLTLFNQKVVSHASKNLKFVWIGMGYDYYDLIYENKQFLYQEQTKKLVNLLNTNTKKSINVTFKNFMKYLIFNKIDKKQLFEKIDYFAPVLESEYNSIASKFNSQFPKYICWNYGTTAKIIEGNLKQFSINGNNILIGNSASPENNHLEILDFLKTQKLKDTKIICPLSYGSYEYACIVKNRGRDYFGDCFVALDSFMPYDEYMTLLSSCSNVIMNHHRQQAGGNISAMLYMGAKVFLNEVNPFYAFHKGRGSILFTIEELRKNPSLLDSKLPDIDANINKQVIEKNANKELLRYKTENLIKTVLSSSIHDGLNDY